jgi:hypothetical protein
MWMKQATTADLTRFPSRSHGRYTPPPTMPRPGFERILELSDSPPDHRRQVPEPLTRLSTLNPSALLSIDSSALAP